jgi:hypothetical protein
MKHRFGPTTLLIILGLLLSGSQPAVAQSVQAELPISYVDIANFTNAYRMIETDADMESVLQTQYLDKASPGLREFSEQFDLTAVRLARSMRKYPKYYASLLDLESKLREQEPGLVDMFRKLSAILPESETPTIYYLVGGMRAGGNGGEGNYVLIGAELFARTAATDMSEFEPGFRLFDLATIEHIVAHEVTHVIQESIQGDAYLEMYTDESKGTLLAYSLREGGADFFAQILSGGHINERAHQYGNPREEALWNIYKQQMNSTNLGDWFFYTPKQHPQWPKDLGYWMGFKIMQYYYRNAPNRQEALIDLLSATDYSAFFERTNYAKKFD